MTMNNLMAHILEPIKNNEDLKQRYLNELDCPKHPENTRYNNAECDDCTHYHETLELLNE